MPVSPPCTYDCVGISHTLQSLNLQLRDLFQVRREEQSFQGHNLPESLLHLSDQDMLSGAGAE